jgi:nuclear GTP-binding protein
MGKGKNTVKKEGHGRVKGKSASGSKLVGEFATGVTRVKGENFYRDAKSASRVKMLNGGKAVRDRDGKIVKAAAFQSKEAEPGRVQPDKRWFGNTRVISQDALDHFRTALANHKSDPFSVLLKRNRLPMGLIQDESKNASGKRPHIVDTEPFSNTFGPKAQRKRPRLDMGSFEELGENTAAIDEAADEAAAMMTLEEAQAAKEAAREAAYGNARSLVSAPIYQKGTSRRIWGELYKVLDSSDVVIHVLDARDPIGSRCKPVVEYLRKEKSHKNLIYVLNKCDLVPTWVTVSVFLGLVTVIPPFPHHPTPFPSHTPVRVIVPLLHNWLLREWKNERLSASAPPLCPSWVSEATKLSSVLDVRRGAKGRRWRTDRVGVWTALAQVLVRIP